MADDNISRAQYLGLKPASILAGRFLAAAVHVAVQPPHNILLRVVERYAGLRAALHANLNINGSSYD